MEKNPEVVYSSRDILGDSVAGKKGDYFVKVKKDKESSLVKIWNFITGSRKRIIITITVIVVFLLTVVALVLLSLGVFNFAGTSDDEPMGGEEFRIDLENPQEVEAELKNYDEKIEQAETPENAAELYDERGMYLWDALAFSGNQDYLEQILADFKKAEKLNPSARTAYNLCMFFRVYESPNTDATDYCAITTERDPNFIQEIDENYGEG